MTDILLKFSFSIRILFQFKKKKSKFDEIWNDSLRLHIILRIFTYTYVPKDDVTQTLNDDVGASHTCELVSYV